MRYFYWTHVIWYFSPVYLVNILHHHPPEVFVQIWQTREGPFQHLSVLCLQYRRDDDEEVAEVRVKVHLEVASKLNYKTGSDSQVNIISSACQLEEEEKNQEELTLEEVGKPCCSSLTGGSSDSPQQRFGETPACWKTDSCSTPLEKTSL